jgi:hypothetical protein
MRGWVSDDVGAQTTNPKSHAAQEAVPAGDRCEADTF